ncbi:MAG: DUF262 domain-containing protein [Metamycoplasmataceae bacterium]
MTVEKRNLIELLENCRIMKIPFFQREYTWDTHDTEKLLNDIYYSKTENYFLGSIILKKGKGHENIIIDGQQRISTIILIYKIILKYFKEFDSYELAKLKIVFNSLEFDSFNLKDGDKLLQIIRNDDGQFDPKIKNTKYYENYLAIDRFIRNMSNSNIDKEGIAVMLFEMLGKVFLSEIIVEEDVDQHKLFSQINSSGKPLTAFDLVKNYLFSDISNELEDNYKKEDTIKKMLDKLSDVTEFKNSKLRDNALRHFIAFKTISLPNQNKDAIYQSFISLKNKYYNDKSIEMFDDLYKFLFYYDYLINRKWEDNKTLSPMLLTLIESFSTYSVVLITIFIINSELHGYEINMSNEQVKIIEKSLLILEAYKYKREFYGHSEKTITRFIPKLSADIRNEYFDNYETNVVLYFFLVKKPSIDATYKMPSERDFEKGLNINGIYASGSSKEIIKSFLYRLSNHQYKDSPKLSTLSIEHIVPQDQSKWMSFGYNVDVELIDKLHTIGNLTLTSYNSELSNNIFSKKQELFKNKDGFPLNKYFINEVNEWNLIEIEKRAKWIYEICQKIWNFKDMDRIISDNQEFFNNYNYHFKEEIINETKVFDFGIKNGNLFHHNISYFKNIINLIDSYNIKKILSNLMVHGLSTKENELKVFGVQRSGWISQSIYSFFDIQSKEVKGKYDEEEFEEFIVSKNQDINLMVEYIRKELK